MTGRSRARSWFLGAWFHIQLAKCYENVFQSYIPWSEEPPEISKEWYEDLPSVVILDPEMKASAIQEKIYQVQNATTHFGKERYAILLKPGVYPGSILFNPGYYTSIIGVGADPEDVSIPDMWVSNDITGHATNNFWRSLEGVTITAPRTTWAVSQASPLRRSIIAGELWLSHTEGYSSGGFISDVKIGKRLVMGTQQQWFFRQMTLPTEGLKCWQGWNYVFMGVEGIDMDMAYQCDKGTRNKVSIMDRTARSAEKPYIVLEESEWMIHVPKVVHDPAPGYIQDRAAQIAWKLSFREIFVANPGMSTNEILQGMRDKAGLLLSPGVYRLSRPLEVTKHRFVVLGIGFPTLVSPQGLSCLKVRPGLSNVRIASIIFDANTDLMNEATEPLLQWGEHGLWSSRERSAMDQPGVASDIVARVGAFAYLGCTLKRADQMVQFNEDNLIVDNVWVWHADHDDCSDFVMAKGADMMDHQFKSDQCQSQHGIVVNGNNVVAYGVAVEHINGGHMLVWNGEGGQLYFFQAELPYHSDLPLRLRYAAYAVNRNTMSHFAVGLGAYAIDKKPAYTAFLLSEYTDLRNVVTVVINAPDDTIHHQVCQVSTDGALTCYKPWNCSWSRCWRPSVPYVDAHTMPLRGARWPQIPPTEKLPEPKILKRISSQDTYGAQDWHYQDYQMDRPSTHSRSGSGLSVLLPWLALTAGVGSVFLFFLWTNRASKTGCARETEVDLMLRGYDGDHYDHGHDAMVESHAFFDEAEGRIIVAQ